MLLSPLLSDLESHAIVLPLKWQKGSRTYKQHGPAQFG